MKEYTSKELREMRNTYYSQLQYETDISRLAKVFGSTQTAKYVFGITKTKEDREKVQNTYRLIINLFKSKGFSKEEAIRFINKENNRYILNVDYESILKSLAILSIVNKDEEALFEKPRILINNHNKSKLYAAVKELQESGKNVEIDDIRKELVKNMEKVSTYEEKLTPQKMQLLCHTYVKRITDNLSYQKGVEKTK